MLSEASLKGRDRPRMISHGGSFKISSNKLKKKKRFLVRWQQRAKLDTMGE